VVATSTPLAIAVATDAGSASVFVEEPAATEATGSSLPLRQAEANATAKPAAPIVEMNRRRATRLG
jgi:hypothetical protein